MQWAGKPTAEGAARGGADGSAGLQRRPIVLLDGHAAVQAAVGRRYSASKERYMPERFYAYADANAGRTALTEEARRGAMDCIRMMCGAKTKKHAALAGEIGAMAAADASGHEAWRGRIEDAQRAAVADPRSRAARRWMMLREGALPRIILGEGRHWTEYEAATAFHSKAYMVKYLNDEGRAGMLSWLYERAAPARLAAAEAAKVAEADGAGGGGGARLVAMDPDILAFAGELRAMTGGRLRVMDADRVSPAPTRRQRAERAELLRRLIPRRGQSFTAGELKKRLGARGLGRITKIAGNKLVVIVRERDDGLTYARNGLVVCVGEGGDMQHMDRNNKAIRDSGPEGYAILLFERAGDGRLAFVSRLRYASHGTRRPGLGRVPAPGTVFVFRLRPVGGGA